MSMLVSVIIPVYNAARFLGGTLDSVIAQSYSNWEVIAVDDGSTDGSWKVLQAYAKKDPRIRAFQQVNQGAGAARNKAITEARSEWLFLLDADDEMLPTRIERQLTFLNDNPDVKATSCRAQYIDEHGRASGRTTLSIKTREDFARHIRENEAIGLLHPGAVMHRETVAALGGYRGEFWPAEDIDLWNRIAEDGHVILGQDEVLMRYRVHGGSVITSKFMFGRMRYEWVRASMVARRSGQPEPTWDEFQKQWADVPLGRRLNRNRKHRAKEYYRLAAQAFLFRKYPKAVAWMLVAGILQPAYVFPRIKAQLGL